jgi:hypothetical protein
MIPHATVVGVTWALPVGGEAKDQIQPYNKRGYAKKRKKYVEQ